MIVLESWARVNIVFNFLFCLFDPFSLNMYPGHPQAPPSPRLYAPVTRTYSVSNAPDYVSSDSAYLEICGYGLSVSQS